MTRPCQTTPEGSIYPGRPGESLADFVARETAQVQDYLDRHPEAAAPSIARSDSMGLPHWRNRP